MVSVQLKVKEFLVIANSLFTEQSSQAFSLLSRIKSATSGQSDDALVTVDATTQEVELVYRKLTLSPEGIYSEINASMFAQLQAQIVAGTTAGDTEWIYIGTNLNAIRTENLGRIDDYVNYVKAKFA